MPKISVISFLVRIVWPAPESKIKLRGSLLLIIKWMIMKLLFSSKGTSIDLLPLGIKNPCCAWTTFPKQRRAHNKIHCPVLVFMWERYAEFDAGDSADRKIMIRYPKVLFPIFPPNQMQNAFSSDWPLKSIDRSTEHMSVTLNTVAWWINQNKSLGHALLTSLTPLQVIA